MRKFWVSLLSVLVLFGGFILVSCGTKNVSIELNETYTEICLNDDLDNIATITAEVKGISNGTVTVSSSNTAIATATSSFSRGVNVISIEGLSEGEAEIYVTNDYNGKGVQRTISVVVYSDVKEMAQKETDSADGKSDMFVVRNQGEVEDMHLNLNEYVDSFIRFTPEKARKNITWSLPENFELDAEVTNNILTVGKDYLEKTITVVATDEITGVKTDVTLGVVDKLDENTISMRYNHGGAGDRPLPDISENEGVQVETPISLVPNIANDPAYRANVIITVPGQEGVDITPRIFTNGVETNLLVAERLGYEAATGTYIYELRAGNVNVNRTFEVYFDIGYEKYNYKVSSQHFTVRCYERINRIEVLSVDGNNEVDATGITQDIYTNYSNADGAFFKVRLLPTTVVNSSRMYKISLDYTKALLGMLDTDVGGDIERGDIIDEDSLSIYYRQGNGLVRLNMSGSDLVYTGTTEINAEELYIKANDSRVKAYIKDVVMTLTSVDNVNTSAEVKLNLYKAAGALDFGEGDYSVNLATHEAKTLTKTFTLAGQTSIDGLSIETTGNGFAVSGIRQVSADMVASTVTFSIDFSVRNIGYTGTGSYKIKHRNGFASAEYPVSLYLPLTDAQVDFDRTNDSVLDFSTDGKLYQVAGNSLVEVTDGSASISALYAKNGSTVQLVTRNNQSNGQTAEAIMGYNYFDFNSEDMTREAFEALLGTNPSEIYNRAAQQSRFISVTHANKAMQCNAVGCTYLVITFEGRDANGNGVTFVRIVFVENYVTPSEMIASPQGVSVYANDSVSQVSETERIVRVSLGNIPVTYNDLMENYSFISGIAKGNSADLEAGKATVSAEARTAVWEGGYYMLSEIDIQPTYLTFKITGLSTRGVQAIPDQLTICYTGKDKKMQSAVIDVRVVNADRIETVEILNIIPEQDEEGNRIYQMYFDVDERNPAVLVFRTQPEYARNKNLTYLVTSRSGDVSGFVAVSDSNNGTLVRLRSAEGMIGYIYTLPTDAIFQNMLSYYTKSIGADGKEVYLPGVPVNYYDLGKDYTGSDFDGSWYSYLKANAYFLNNNGEAISFNDILVRVEVTVADGSSEELAYHIFTEQEVDDIRKAPSKWYRLMNNVTLNNWTSISEFTGGIKGDNDNVTINLNGQPFADINRGTVKELIFNGQVVGGGFIANVNYGTVDTVTIDIDTATRTNVDGSQSVYVRPSLLNAAGKEYAGIFVGQNHGVLNNVSALGASITEGIKVGGLVGQMSASGARLTNARFEIYTFEGDTYNSLRGQIVGGAVGEFAAGTLNNVYAYDYALKTDGSSKLNSITGGAVGALVGQVTGSANIANSFAVVNIDTLVGMTNTGAATTIQNVYLSNYVSGSYNSYAYDNAGRGGSLSSLSGLTLPSDVWALGGSEGFMDDINGGFPYLKAFYQNLPVSSVSEYHVALNNPLKTANGLYKAINVTASETEERAILFRYEVSAFDQQTMNSSELRDLTELNTISLADLLGISAEQVESLVILSANTGVIDISGSNLVIRRQGEVELTLSSKQDYTKSKTISVKTIYALSDIRAERISLGGSIEIAQNSPEPLQRGKNLTVVYSFTNPSLHLGNRGNIYDLISNSSNFVSVIKEGDTILRDNVESSDATFTYTTTGLRADNFNIETTLELKNLLNVTLDDQDKAAIDKVFTKAFRLRLFNGAIDLGLAGGGEEISITPSTMGVVEVTLRTNDYNDEITPIISLKTGNGYDALTIEKTSDNMWTASYLGVPRLTITREAWTTTEDAGGDSWTKKTNFYFSVHESYRGQIPASQQYNVLLQSNLQVESDDFELLVSRQDFTKIDISNYQVNKIVYNKLEPNSNVYGTIYTVNESIATSVLAPGSTSILAVNINPDYAYYQYLTLEYSTTAADSILSPLTLDYMTRRGATSDYYVARDGSVVSPIGNGIRVVPANKNVNNLYFKLWAKNEISSDLVVTLTAKFYDGISSTPIKTVNFPLTISHLTEPKILVDGSTAAIVAKGQTATVQVIVPYDQEVDIDSLTVDNVQTGITIYSDWEYTPNESAGIKTYTTKLSASIRATLSNDASGMFAISVSVRRELNGYEEIKATTAMVHLVDFKVDLDNIKLADSNDDTFIAYVGMAQPLIFDYPLIPGEYRYDESDPASQAAMDSIMAKRNEFADNGYFADPDTRYYINYSNPGTAAARKITVDRRLSFNADGVWHDIYNGVNGYNTIGGRVEWFYDDVRNIMSVRGSEISNAEINMRLRTTMNIAGQPFTHDYEFKIVVRAYSDEDVPLLVYNAEQFLNMAEGDAQNYILMDDITLENYTPIDTTAINSLDGNGFTIHINSFNTNPDGSALDLALFNNVSSNTTLKNVRVNLYRGGQITVDVSKYTSINIAGFALSNSGTITNCEVVSFRGDGTEVIGDTGLNIKYIRGTNTSPISITGLNETSTVAGFVNTNTGSITNSRVGGDSIYTIGAEVSVNTSGGQQTVIGYNRDQYSLEKFNIIAQGNVAGFANANSGAIASSFVKRVGFVNDSDNSSFYTAGFVGMNSGKILTSYIEGVKEERQTDSQCLQGSSINSKLGIIAGFVYQNSDEGLVQDSYSNILIANKDGDETVFLASGFVYSNEGTLENCFSSSQVANLRFSQMNFSGVDSKGNLQTVGGNYVNCYYYVSRSTGSDNPVEAGYGTGATKLTNIDDPKYFYGFSFTESSRKVEGIWAFEDSRLVLVEPNNIAFSNRYRLPDSEDKEKYSLPYSTVYSANSNTPISLRYGSDINPIIIRTAQEFVNVTGRSTSSFISSYFTDTTVFGNYRLVNDIDFSELLSDEQKSADMPSTVKTFTGTFYGNGFTMTNLSITAANNPLAFGLFASIENAVLINVDLTVTQVVNTGATMVGALAGYIKNSNIINVNITNNENSEIQGLNFVGGVAGMVYSDSKLKNVTVYDPNIIANSIPHNGVAGAEGSDATMDNRRNPVATLNAKTALNFRTYLERNVGSVTLSTISPAIKENIADMVRNFSYAGGLFGYVDTFKSDEVGDEAYSYNSNMELDDYSIIKVRLLNSVNVRGQVAGGIAGFTGYNTHIKDAGVELADDQATSTSHIIAVRFYAGGLVGQAYGSFAQVYSQYTATLQNNIENSLRDYYISSSGERGSANIFAVTNATETYSQKYIGGLIGYAGSGSIAIAYSKLNVTNTTAEYAGGLIGGVNSGNSDTYYISDGKDDNIITNYYINEAFATGDVRAKNAAGGIIGQINTNSRIKLAAVNAANFLGLERYDGSAGQLTAEELAGEGGVSDLTFDRVNVYAIAGNFSFEDEHTTAQEKVDALGFVKLYSQEVSESDTTTQADVSVGTVKRYTASLGSDIKLSVYPGYDRLSDTVTDANRATVESLSETFSLPNISTMETAEQGHQAVYGSFIGIQLWSTENWYHNSDSFYPNIKFSVAQQAFIYLDQYNALEVLRSMQSSNVPVKVRGKVSENVERYGDVDLRNILTREEFWSGSGAGVSGFYGTFSGFASDEDLTVMTEYGARPGLILSTPLFSNLKEGFVISDLTVRYEANENLKTEGTLFDLDRQAGGIAFSGAFINDEVKANGSGTIRNLTMIFNDRVYLQEESGTSSGAGLIAPSLHGVDLNGIKIEFFKASGGDAAVTATSNRFGLIAGSYIQDAADNIKATDISIYDGRDNGGNLVILNSSKSETYVGAYFGSVNKSQTTSDGAVPGNLAIQIGSLKHWEMEGVPLGNHSWKPDDSVSETIFINNEATNLYLGGYIGRIEAADEIEFAGSTGDGTLANVRLGIGAKITGKLNAGLVIGSLEKDGLVTIQQSGDGRTPTVVSGRIYSTVDTDTAAPAPLSETNLGGLIGHTTSDVSIINVNVALQVDGKQDGGALENGGNEEDFKNNYTQNVEGNYKFNPFRATSAVANVGGFIGYAKNSVTISRTNEGYSRINEGQEPISIRAKAVNVGSMIGLFEKTVSGTGAGTPANILNVNGQFRSNALIQVEGTDVTKTADPNKNVGGFIGKISLTASGENPSYNISIGDTDTAKPSVYMGQIFLADAGYQVGGIIGNINGMAGFANERGSFTLQNTVFGGAVKIYGKETTKESAPWGGTFTIGGSIGNFVNREESDTQNGKASVNINNNYNFGDVFVMYRGEGQTLGQMNYGGLIGTSYTKITNGNAIRDNFILNTYNNPRPNTGDVANAVFGSVTQASLSQTNYYNHAVCLLTDDNAIDAGYTKDYKDTEATTGGGYSVPGKTAYAYCKEIDSLGLAHYIASHISNVYNETGEGTKLKPRVLPSGGVNPNIEAVFNGMYYYTIENNMTILEGAQIAETLSNIAIIGNGYTIDATASRFVTGLIDNLTSQAFISGLNVKIDKEEEITQAYKDVTADDGTTTRTPLYREVGGLVREMNGGTIYAVGLLGRLSIGGDGHYSVGGMVGTMNRGYIMNSFTDVEIVYRAAGIAGNLAGKASAIANTTNTDAVIDRTYAVGSVTSYIDAYLDAFSSGAATVRNSYTAANLFWNDYTSADTTSENKLSAFNGATCGTETSSLFYDAHAMGTVRTAQKVTSAGVSNQTNTLWNNTAEMGGKWVKDNNYNYGYPTQEIGYLKASSYKKLETTSTDATTGIETNTYSRLTNAEAYTAKGATGGYNNYYYTIPNVWVWYQRLGQFTGTKTAPETDAKITLRNDIDFEFNSSGSAVDDGAITLAGNVHLILDGLTHRLYNFKGAGMFTNINASGTRNKIVNVDILKANISGKSILIQTLGNADIANVTLSGDVLASTATDSVGALAATVSNATISSVTNNAYVKTTDSTVKWIGGIVGKAASGVTIKRSVNNGPVYYTAASNSAAIVCVGGIVGDIEYVGGTKSTVEYCYNTASIAAGYNSTTSAGHSIIAGGIAGYNVGEIDHCYNSGLIKSGNKQSTNANFAGGIVGKMTSAGTVANSINEGSVEALAQNAQYIYEVEGSEYKRNVYIRSKTAKNVYADGIGFNTSNGYLSQTTTTNANTNTEIIHNGSAYALNSNGLSDRINSSESYSIDIGTTQLKGGYGYFRSDVIALSDGWGPLRKYGFAYSTEYYDGANNFEKYTNDYFTTTARDNYNLPTAFYLKVKYRVGMETQGSNDSNSSKFTWVETSDYVSWAAKSSSKTYQEWVESVVFRTSGKTQDANANNKRNILGQTSSNGQRTDIRIGGQRYYLTNGSATQLYGIMNSAFIYETTYTTGTDVIKLDSFSEYEFSCDDPLISAVIPSDWTVNANGSITFKLSIYASEDIKDWNGKTIKFGYSKSQSYSIDLSALKYSYYPETGRVDIDVSDDGFAALRDILEGVFTVGEDVVTEIPTDETTGSVNVMQGFLMVDSNGNNTDIYLTYENGKLVYYKDLYIVKNGNYTACNGRELTPADFQNRTYALRYGLEIYAYFEVKESDSSTWTSGSKVVRPSGTDPESSSYNKNTTYNENGRFDTSETVTLGDSGKVTIKKNDKYNFNKTITSINTISDYLVTPKTEFVDNLLFLSDVTIVNRLTLVNAEQEASIKLGDLPILTYTKVEPDVGTGDGETTPAEPIFVWTLVNNRIEMAEGLEEGAASYVFNVVFDEETMTLSFVYDKAEVSEEERDALSAYINGLVEGDNYLKVEVALPEPGEGEEQPEVPEVITIDSVTIDETPVKERIYTFTSEFSVSIARETAMTLKFAGNQIAKWNGAWTNVLSDLTIDGVQGIVTLEGNKFTITFSDCKEEDKAKIEAILNNWTLTYDSIAFAPTITNLSSGDSVALKYLGAEIAVYDGSWTKSSDLTIEGLTAAFASGTWSFNNVEYGPENDIAATLVAELAKISNAYKSMRIEYALPVDNVDKAIVYGATEDTVVATYSNSRLSAVGDFSNDVSVSTSGNNLVYQINCDGKFDAQINEIIAEINKSSYYRQFKYEEKYRTIEVSRTAAKQTFGSMSIETSEELETAVSDNDAFILEGTNGQYAVKINYNSSGKWTKKTYAEGNFELYIGQNTITGYVATYKVKSATLAFTNSTGDYGYLQTSGSGLVGLNDSTEFKGEVTSGVTKTQTFAVEGDSFNVSYNLYRTYVENSLKSGVNTISEESRDDFDEYFDDLNSMSFTYSLGYVKKVPEVGDDGKPTGEQVDVVITYASYKYNSDGLIYAQNSKARQVSTDGKVTWTDDTTVAAYTMQTGINSRGEKVKTWTYVYAVYADPNDASSDVVTTTYELLNYNYSTNKWTVYGRDGEFDSLESAFASEYAINIEEKTVTYENPNTHQQETATYRLHFEMKDFKEEANILYVVGQATDSDKKTVRSYVQQKVTNVILQEGTESNPQEVSYDLQITSRIDANYKLDMNKNKTGDFTTPVQETKSYVLNYKYSVGDEVIIEDEYGNLVSSDGANFASNGERVNFNYKPDGVEVLILNHNIIKSDNFNLTNDAVRSMNGDSEEEGYEGIIFTRNISLGEVTCATFAGKINGDDYTLQYYTNQSNLFDTMAGHIKDLNVAGQMKYSSGAASILGRVNSAKLININTFGNIRNVTFNSSSTATGVIIENLGDMQNISNYASINGLNATSTADAPTIAGIASTINGSANNLNNKSLLVAGNGYRGLKSTFGKGDNGRAGGSIYSICKTYSGDSLDYDVSMQFAVSGKGGASGVGADGAKGKMLTESETMAYATSGGTINGVAGQNGCKPGMPGATGKVYIYGTSECGNSAVYREGGSGIQASGGNGGLSGLVYPAGILDAEEVIKWTGIYGGICATASWVDGPFPFADVAALIAYLGSIGALNGWVQPVIYYGVENLINGTHSTNDTLRANPSYYGLGNKKETGQTRPRGFLIDTVNSNNIWAPACGDVING